MQRTGWIFFSLVAASCAAPDDVVEQSLDETEDALRRQRCEVAPHRVSAGETFTITDRGHREGVSVRFKITTRGGAQELEAVSGPDGRATVSTTADVPGRGFVKVFREDRHGHSRARGYCRFRVFGARDPAPNPDPNTDPAPNPDPNPDPNTDPAPNPDPNTDPNTDPAPNPDPNTDPNTDPAPNPDPNTDPAPNPDPNTDPAPNPDPNTDPAPNPDPNPDTNPSWPTAWASLEDQVLALVNEARARGATCGAEAFGPSGPLVMSATLREAARGHSSDMATRNYFSHSSLDGRSFHQRMLEAGWEGACPCGENIAAGQTTAEQVVAGWLSSPGHCVNIMNPSYGALGVGYAERASSSFRRYWTQDFAAR